MEAVTGTKKEISYSTKVACTQCKGNGTADGNAPPTCSTCGGTGTVILFILLLISFF